MTDERQFTMQDQEAFAVLSGDRNTLHMDAVFARRTQAGTPVVHGMHALIWALDEIARTGASLSEGDQLDVQFRRFVPVGTPAGIRQPKPLHAEVWVDGAAAITLSLRVGAHQSRSPDLMELPEIHWRDEPQDLSFAQAAAAYGRIRPVAEPEAFRAMAPWLCAAIGARRVAALATLSNIVGMLCPGLHSVFREAHIRFDRDALDSAGIGFRVSTTDDRFQVIRLEVNGEGISGTVVAMMRPAPVEAPSAASLMRHVHPDEFRGSSALVIGGSRGLGAMTAKLLAVGGARLTVTYAQGKAEAETLAAEIGCDVLRFDALAPHATELPPASHLYYFATPHISRQSVAVLNPTIYDEFEQYYVHAFHAICVRLSAASPLSAFYPSSVFVAERPKGMTEYAMAKAAGEILCADMQRSIRGLRIIVARLPRMLTDQTATSVQTGFEDPVAVMLPHIRQVQSLK